LADVPLLGDGLALMTRQATRGLLEIAAVGQRWDPGAFCVVRPSWTTIVVYYGLLLVGDRSARSRIPRVLGRVGALLSLLWLHGGPPPPPGIGRPEIVMLDVGQGLSVAVRGPRGDQLIVDAGGSADPRFDPGERVVLPYLVEQGGRRVEAVILTHDHVDHVGGASAVLREIEVGQLWIGPGAQRSRRFSSLVRLARKRGAAVVLAEAGLTDIVAGVPVRVVAPTRDPAHGAANDRSMVVLVGEPPRRLLVTGDLEERGEQALLASGAPLASEALVVAHHGSRSGTSEAFLLTVRPHWALISVGRRNPFGHPHRELLERLAHAGADVLRTDQMGNVQLRPGRNGWWPMVAATRCTAERE
jgi:beta-lactamase superfamily II metal-dependent hydrolase